MVDFGDVVETRYVLSEEQLRRSQFGFSPVYYSGNPIVYSLDRDWETKVL